MCKFIFFHLPVDDIVLMAVVDALENLLHKDSTITLGELSSLEDLIEQFSSLADFCDEVVSFLILEELVHLDDIWMILDIKIDRV